MKNEYDEVDLKLLDEIFVSNLGSDDKYLLFAVKHGLPNYLKLYSRRSND